MLLLRTAKGYLPLSVSRELVPRTTESGVCGVGTLLGRGAGPPFPPLQRGLSALRLRDDPWASSRLQLIFCVQGPEWHMHTFGENRYLVGYCNNHSH